MRICFVAPANNYHTQKWCKYFIESGHDVHVVSFQEGILPGVTLHQINCSTGVNASDINKLKYLFQATKIKKCIKEIAPDVVNVHYATSYGTVMALTGIKNYVLSVWGSDVYEFPKKSILHRLMLQFSLNAAGQIFSTSQAMADEAKLYTKKALSITPFGVDIQLFSPSKRTREQDDGDKFVIGTVKSLAPIYGIDILLKAAKRIQEVRSDIPLQVRIAGKGVGEAEYKKLAEDLGIAEITHWLGFISQEQAAAEWANMDVAVILSRAESFGVSAVEAQASGIPVVVTNIPGLMEATNPGVTSVVVSVDGVDEAAREIVNLYDDFRKRKKMGEAGRGFVAEHYEYNDCFCRIEEKFAEMVAANRGVVP